MVATQTPICDFGRKAVDFSLMDADGRSYGLEDARGAKGTLVMFICNHCPYVRAVVDRIARDVRDLQAKASARSRSCPTTTGSTRKTRRRR